MRRLIPLAALAAVAVASAACSDSMSSPTNATSARTSVELTDSPFPYDLVSRVDIYVVRIDASTSGDTTSANQSWVTITSPMRQFDLLDLQNGTTALLGAGTIPTAHYAALRMILNTDSSSLTTADGRVLKGSTSGSGIHWQASTGTPTLYAKVQSPLGIEADGASIVIDFDVGRSFLYNGNDSYTFLPWFRAVVRNETGAISGHVSYDAGIEGHQAVQNASVSVFSTPTGDSTAAMSLIATATTDAQGAYTVSFLAPGHYAVRADPPTTLSANAATLLGVTVAGGATTSGHDLLLATGGSTVDSTGTMRIAPWDTSIVVGQTIPLTAMILTSGHAWAPMTGVSWQTSNPSIVTVDANGVVRGVSAGVATITATGDEANRAIATVTVLDGSATGTIAAITITPHSATVAVGDSVTFRATLTNAAGHVIANGQVSWTSLDPLIAQSLTVGEVLGKQAGTAHIVATSGGVADTATVTVH